jgi:hypothetical protein
LAFNYLVAELFAIATFKSYDISGSQVLEFRKYAGPGRAVHMTANGGSSGDDGTKPYGDQASNIVFIDNIFQRGPEGNCGYYFPITDFDSNRPGNQWVNNTWEDGATLPPAN